MQKIILASKSPRRKQLLLWAEIPFEIIPAEADESFPPGLSAEDAAIYIAKNKALAIKNLHGDLVPILAADTIVVVDKKMIGKPVDKKNAVEILSELSGEKHSVVTGVCILYNKKEIAFADVTEVEFYPLTPAQINFYIDKYKPYDKAGAYAIQEWIGVVGIKGIKGDFYNVMGLPVSRVVMELNNIGKRETCKQ